MMIDLDLIDFLSIAGNAPVEQNKISDGTVYPAVFLQRRASNQNLFLDGSLGLYDTNFDVEIYGEDIDQVEQLTDTLRSACHGFLGQMGSTFVVSMFATDQEEDYQSKVEMNSDAGINVSSFSLEISHG